MAGRTAAAAEPVPVAPNAVAESPDMGKLKKEGFMATLGHNISNAAQGKSVIDRLSMRNILPQWDPNGEDQRAVSAYCYYGDFRAGGMDG